MIISTGTNFSTFHNMDYEISSVNNISEIQCSVPIQVSKEEWNNFIKQENSSLWLEEKLLNEETYDNYEENIFIYNPTGKNITFLFIEAGEPPYELNTGKTWHEPGKYDYSKIKTWIPDTINYIEKSLLEIKPQREDIKYDRLESVKDALKSGVCLPPIKLSYDGSIIDGNHRYKAALELGLNKIPCKVC